MNSKTKLSKNISVGEIECNCGCGLHLISPRIIDAVQDVRDRFDKPVIINNGNHSACRCEKHNKEVGGAKKSMHLPNSIGICRAIDFHVDGISTSVVWNYLEEKYSDTFGIGLYDSFIHLDDRLVKTRWNG